MPTVKNLDLTRTRRALQAIAGIAMLAIAIVLAVVVITRVSAEITKLESGAVHRLVCTTTHCINLHGLTIPSFTTPTFTTPGPISTAP